MYKAIFEIPATIQVEVFIDDAGNQVDALANAHDRLADAAKRKSTVIGMSLDHAKNVSLEKLVWGSEDAPKPAVPTAEGLLDARRDGYKLHLYRGDLPAVGAVAHLVLPFPEFGTARQTLNDIVDAGVEYASGRIVNDLTGNNELSARNPRGNWEVFGVSRDGEDRHVESWLTKEQALDTAKKLVVRDDIQTIFVKDFTNRAAGSVVFKRIG